jgi:o-succinylbenzoate---CoA ligase
VDVTAHRHAHAGELIAYALPPGPVWLDILAAHADSGASFLPVDVRLNEREQRRLIARAAPTMLATPEEEVLFGGTTPSDPERAWAVVATSGTAGEPRLVELPRTAVGAAVAGSLQALDASAFDPWVSCLSPAHMGGLLVLLRGALAGAPIEVRDRFEPRWVAEEAPDGAHVALVPLMLERLVATAVDLSRLGTLLIGGGGLEPALRDAAARLGARVVTTYGLTESCGGIAYDGIPFDDAAARIGEGSSIELRGPTLMDGYRGDPPATARAFTVDGWLRTGDLGSLDAEGRLVVHGRADEAIRTGGETVWPEEVEAVLRSHSKVADVAVAGGADPSWGQRVIAWVVPADPSDLPTLEDLREHSRGALARFKAPRELRIVASLPRTPSGKVRRNALQGSA